MKYWNKNLKNTSEYIPGEQPDDLDEYIKLNTNENPFGPPGPVLNAMQKACNETLKRYPDPTADEVRKIFADDNNIDVDNLFISNGSDEIFTLIFRGFIDQDGLAAFPYPSYSLYDTLAEINGIKYEKVNLNDDFSFDLNKFLKKKYNLVIIANPNNPTGTYCSVDEIKVFLKKFKGLLVVDEAYIDFYGGSSIELIKEFDNIIVTRSFSKSYSLAGLRVGIAAADKEIIKGFMKIKDSYNINSIAIVGAKASLLEKKGFNYNLEMTKNNKEYLEEMLEGIGFNIIPSRANFIFAKHSDMKAEDIYKQLKERKILVRFFNEPAKSDYIRISIGTMMEIKTIYKELKSILKY